MIAAGESISKSGHVVTASYNRQAPRHIFPADILARAFSTKEAHIGYARAREDNIPDLPPAISTDHSTKIAQEESTYSSVSNENWFTNIFSNLSSTFSNFWAYRTRDPRISTNPDGDCYRRGIVSIQDYLSGNYENTGPYDSSWRQSIDEYWEAEGRNSTTLEVSERSHILSDSARSEESERYLTNEIQHWQEQHDAIERLSRGETGSLLVFNQI